MNEVGGQRGTEFTALFQPPLPECFVHLFFLRRNGSFLSSKKPIHCIR
jgi:hypothetical protein